MYAFGHLVLQLLLVGVSYAIVYRAIGGIIDGTATPGHTTWQIVGSLFTIYLMLFGWLVRFILHLETKRLNKLVKELSEMSNVVSINKDKKDDKLR